MNIFDSRRTTLLVLTVAGCLSAALQLPPVEKLMIGGGVEPTNVASRLAEDGTLGDPYTVLPTGPTAHVSPLFPVYLAALTKLFGRTPFLSIAIIVLLFVVHTAYPVLLWLAGDRILGSENAGISAALLAIFFPTFPLMVQWDYIYAADFLLLACIMTAKWPSSGASGVRRPLIAGFLTGLLSLWNSSTVLITTPWWAFLFRREIKRMRGLGRAAIFFACGFWIAVTPWAVRNYFVLGSPVFLRSNLGLELAVSNNGHVTATQHQNLENGTFGELHPNSDLEQAREIVLTGEAAYNRRKMDDALNWIRSHPRRFAELTLQRIFYFWLPYPGEYGNYSYRIRILTCLSFGGLVLLIRRRHAAAWFFVSVLALYPVVFYLVHVSIRLRMPLIWIEVLMAGYLLAPLAGRARELLRRLDANGNGAV